ncbi:MAG: hypothetical protein HRT74_06425 [Flavobacteriales bacterium]|nr:hypothetical protein [Flavobacteriales bacterium]
MKFKVAALFGFLAIAMCSCHSHEDSPTIKEAVEVHKNMRTLYSDLEAIAIAKKEEVKGHIKEAEMNADTLSAEKLAALNSQLEVLHKELNDWKDGLVEVPGHCFHEEGEAHEHHHHAHLEGLSDQEMLQLQQELEKELKEIEKSIKSIGE